MRADAAAPGLHQRLPALVAALWWGSLSSTGLLTVPLLFVHLPTPALAGQLAARLFSAQTWVALGCALALLLLSRPKGAVHQHPWAGSAMGFILAGMLLALLGEFAIAPRIIARQNLRLWHTVGTALYALHWGCALAVLWQTLVPQPGAAQRADGAGA